MAKVQTIMKENEEVELVVIEFDRDNKRIVLSHKKVGEDVKAAAKAEEAADISAYMEKSSAPETIGDMIKDKLAEAKAEAEEAPAEEAPGEEAPAEEAKPKKKAAKAKKEDAEEAPAEEEAAE